MTTPHPLSVLIVDEHPDLAMRLATLLELDGHTARYATAHRDARTLAHPSPPDVAVLDLGLPDGSGYDLAADLAQLPASPPVLVTWSEHEHDAARAAAAGVVRHFRKGGPLEDLLAFLRTCRGTPMD